MKKEKLEKNLINILLKKSTGFYYFEEQEEYEKPQNINKNFKNISFFDSNVTVSDKNLECNDTINSSNGKEKQDNQNLTLVKKKVTKHYIPPDMLAIKILFEINKEKVNNDDLENLSNDEILKMRDKLIGEILNDTQ